MENFKPESKTTHHLDLDTQVSSVEFTDPEGRRRLVIRGADGKKKLEITYGPDGDPIQIKQFGESDQEQVFTDPETLAAVDRQVHGLLGEKVDERAGKLPQGAVQDGPSTSAEALKIGMLDENFKMREDLQWYQHQKENPKGH